MNSKEKAKHSRLYKTYGLTLKQFRIMCEQQEFRCWICRNIPLSGKLCVDHRHVKGYAKLSSKNKLKEVRGLLCFRCNTALGGLERSLEARKFLGRVNQYFSVFKMKGD